MTERMQAAIVIDPDVWGTVIAAAMEANMDIDAWVERTLRLAAFHCSPDVANVGHCKASPVSYLAECELVNVACESMDKLEPMIPDIHDKLYEWPARQIASNLYDLSEKAVAAAWALDAVWWPERLEKRKAKQVKGPSR